MSQDEKHGRAYFTSDDEPNDYGPDLPYDWEHREGQMRATLLDIERMCLPFRTVLDAGCGTGLLIRAMTEKGYEAQGVDISKWAVANGDPTVQAQLKYGDITNMSWYKDKAFDLVTCMDTLEHLDPQDISRALDELFRVANHEVVFRVPCARPLEWLSDPDPSALKTPTGDDSHEMVTTPAYWEWAITSRGWLLSARTHNVNLCMLPRVCYFVARRPELQYKDRDTKWEDE